MKLTVEIKDGKFEYSYEVGESRHNSSSHLSVDMFLIFSELLRLCSTVTRFNKEEWTRAAIEEKVRKELEPK